MPKPRIGVTEAGDAGIDLSWFDKIKNGAFDGALLITKVSYLKSFQEKALELNETKPVIIHAGITGWGGTPMEPALKPYNEALASIRQFIDNGFPAEQIVLRVDPIIPTDEGIRRAQSVITEAKAVIPDVKRIRISIYDDYHNSRAEMIRRGYEPVDNFTKWKNEQERRPSPDVVRRVAEALLAVADDNQHFELCAEPELAAAYPDRFHWFGCVSQKDCDIMGITVPEGTRINGQNRFGCRCLQLKTEVLSNKRRCPNNCAYCYWGRN